MRISRQWPGRLLLLAWLRDGIRHPLQRLLTLVGVMVAIAVVLAVDLANQSAQRAFDRSMLEVAGAATHQILGPAQGFPETVYRDLRLAGWSSMAPVVEGPLRLESGATVYLLGVDPLAEAPFRSTAAGFGDLPIQRLLTEPGTVLVPPGGPLVFSEDDPEPRVRVQTNAGGFTITALHAEAAGTEARVWVSDMATAQVLLGRDGVLDRIDLALETDAEVRLLEAFLPEDLDVVAVGSRDAAARELAQAFRINLLAMSLLALLVAAFLIYNTQTFSVLRRREVLVALRLLGAERGQIVSVVLLEALLIGLLGSILGVVLGIALAQMLVGQVVQTVSDHFFLVAVTSVEPRPLVWLATLFLGLGLSVLAALAPAWEAARESRMGQVGRMGLEQRTRRVLRLLLLLGGVCVLVAIFLVAWGIGGLVGGFIALFLLITGYLFALPWVLRGLLQGLGRRRGWAPLPRLALRGLARSLTRSGPATVALTLSLAAAIGVSVLVGSFRVSVTEWLGQTLTSDLYVVPVSPTAGRGGSWLPGDWITTLESWPEVASVSTASTVDVVGSEGDLLQVFVLNPHPDWLEHLPVQGRVPADLATRLQEQDAVLVTEGFASLQQVGVGDVLTLTTPSGRRPFTVAAIYRDYSSPQGMVLMHAARYYPGAIPGFAALGLRATSDDLEAVTARLQAWLDAQPVAALITDPERVAEESLEIFDRTFAITHLLRLITLLVAFVAILSALIALQMERAREYAILRSTGVLPIDIVRLVLLQGGLLGAFAAVLAIPLGLVMGWVLIEVINREAFGWQMAVLLPVRPLLENLAIGLGAAVLASLYPAWRLVRMPVVPALRVSV